MPSPEGLHRNWFKDQMKLAGAILVIQSAGDVESGWPDRLVWHPTWDGLVELKGWKTKLKDRQRANIRLLETRRPGHAVVSRAKDATGEGGRLETHDDLLIGYYDSGKEMLQVLAEYEKTQRELHAARLARKDAV